MMKIYRNLFWAVALLLVAGCAACTGKTESEGGNSGTGNENTGGNETPGGGENTEEPAPEPPAVVSKVDGYITSQSLSYNFTYQSAEFSSVSMSPTKITLDPSVQYQDIDGFGAALTGSTCHNLMQMSAADRTKFLRETFDPVDGMGFSFIRMHIGGSDFSMSEYTCCDKPDINFFEIPAVEREGIWPVLREIMQINPSLKIMGSPWSCPKWMKVNPDTKTGSWDKWTSGRLNPKYYADYAEYFVRWIQEMEGEGFPIYAITMQNEPLNKFNSMSLYMPWEDQRDFIKVLGPAFEKANIKTKILLFDHNFDYDNKAGQQQYPLKIYNDATARKYAAGSAWHSYSGHVSELDNIHSAAPDKSIYFTEASIGTWIANGTWDGVFKHCLLSDFAFIFLGTLSRHGSGVILWNLMLDENRGPHRPNGGCSTCFGAVEINSSNYKTMRKSSHYYDIAHCSKVVKTGAKRIKSSGYKANGLSYEAFLNPDGTLAVLALNESSADIRVSFQGPKKGFRFTLPAQSITSLRWNENE